MSRRVPFAIPLAAALAVLAVRSAPPARGCAVAPPKDGKVEATSESAVIIWDAATKTEHFVRSASFSTTSPDFGFLVPTPTKPELGVSDDAVFGALSDVTRPRTEVITRYQTPEISWNRLLPPRSYFTGDANSAPRAPRVQVVEEKKVGTYDAAVLKADDTAALLGWLEKNGYDARPALTDWLKWYVDNKWFVTAFKVSATPPKGLAKAAPGTEATASATPVRLSFKTDRPFYPYREPADVQNAAPSGGYPRLLRVYFLSDGRYDGTLGAEKWPAKVVWSGKITPPAADKAVAKGMLPDGLANREWHLTEFEDLTTPRAGTDEVYFAPAADQAKVERSPYTVYEYREWPPAWLVYGAMFTVPGVIIVGVGYALWRRAKRRKAAAAPPAPTAAPEPDDGLL